VAVAHTADDQVETVLMHLLRGSGLNGLKGMTWRSILPAWDPAIPIVRPLLGTWRAETETWCQQFGLEPLYDASNQDLAFFRNRLRHELIPFLQTYNPGVKDGIWRMAQVLAGDAEVLSEVTAQAWSRCQAEFGAESGSFNLEQFQDLSPGLRRSVLRKAVALLRPGLRDIDFRGVERALAWLGRPVEGKVIDLKDGLCLWIEWGRVHVGEAARPPAPLDCPQVEPGAQFWLQPGDEIRLLNGWVLRASLRAPEDEAVNSSYYLVGEGLGRLELGADLDADALQWPLLVRTAQKGEQFAPLGMGGRHARLSDFFINRKVPRRVRAGWPLVTSGGKVAWLAGLRMGEIGKMSPQTRRCVHIELRKVQN
jgi:tRNA(Ile)-lysidine synthase